MLENIFGLNSAPMKKFMRMNYWMPKFKNKQPWELPFHLPDEVVYALISLAYFGTLPSPETTAFGPS